MRIAISLGRPCDERAERASKVSFVRHRQLREIVTESEELTISNPKEPSIMSSTRSATLAVSIIAPRSLGHSIIVSRRFLPAKGSR